MKGYIRLFEIYKKAKEEYIHITPRIFYNYVEKGLIPKGKIIKRGKGKESFYPENTNGIIYMIEILKQRKIELKDIKRYMDLIQLNKIESLKEIKRMIENDREIVKEIDFSLGIPGSEDLIIKEDYKKILELKLLTRSLVITELDKFKKFLELRAYAEIGKKLINRIMENIENINSQADLDLYQDTMDHPTIYTNIEELDIEKPASLKKVMFSVKYPSPFNLTLVFLKNEIRIS